MEDSDDLAVDVRNAVFGYKPNVPILNNLTLKVPKGKIFSILGSNGAGKTTLVRTILGCNRLKSGSIRVFGVRPGSRRSDIPGVGVGYMPQDLALFEEFTINEILAYYGNIYHMSGEDIAKRIAELLKFLNLPEKERPIGQLSGGQQRRVSIAITLIHRPKLLILDEPTVGVDSLLRSHIWEYLDQICNKYGQTVIIITHYIDESRRAANVAFLRNGSILRQDNPNKLVEEYQSQTLEEVFYLLSQEQRKFSVRGALELPDIEPARKNESNHHDNKNDDDQDKSKFSIDRRRVAAVLWKDLIMLKRNPVLWFIAIFIPVMALLTARYAFARKPKNIPMAIFNDDNQQYSHQFIDLIDKEHNQITFYPDNETAVQSVIDGKNFMAVGFRANFTDTFEYRFRDLNAITDDEIHSSNIPVYIDFTSPMTLLSGAYLLRAFRDFLLQTSDTFGENAYIFFHLVHVEETYFGDFQFSLSDQLDPAIILMETQIVPLIMSALYIINIRRFANYERDLVAGVKSVEILMAHYIQMSVLVVLQALLTMTLAFGINGSKQMGSYYDIFGLLVIFGLFSNGIGITIGIGSVHSLVGAAGFLVFLELTLWLSSGVFWPIQAIPKYVSEIAYINSLTMPLESIRAVMIRGYSLDRTIVWIGYVSTLLYTILINIINLLLFTRLDK